MCKYLVTHQTFNYLTDIFISMDSWFLFKTLGFVLHHYLFWLLNCPRFGQWCPVQDDFFVFLTCPCYYLNIFLLSGPARGSKLILYFSCHNPEINHFSRKPWFLLVQNVIQKPGYGTRSAYCYCGYAPFSSLSVQRIYVCMHVSMYTYSHNFHISSSVSNYVY